MELYQWARARAHPLFSLNFPSTHPSRGTRAAHRPGQTRKCTAGTQAAMRTNRWPSVPGRMTHANASTAAWATLCLRIATADFTPRATLSTLSTPRIRRCETRSGASWELMPISAGSRYHDELISTAVRAAAPSLAVAGPRQCAHAWAHGHACLCPRCTSGRRFDWERCCARLCWPARRSRLQAHAC